MKLQSHLYGIEILSEYYLTSVSNRTPIAPLWNWNKRYDSKNQKDSITPIAPLWNWNILQGVRLLILWVTPIAPLWNWNINNCFVILSALKTPIAPLWNWNFFLNFKSDFSHSLQSHLYGIEISSDTVKMKSLPHSNRTFMELKLVHGKD